MKLTYPNNRASGSTSGNRNRAYACHATRDMPYRVQGVPSILVVRYDQISRFRMLRTFARRARYATFAAAVYIAIANAGLFSTAIQHEGTCVVAIEMILDVAAVDGGVNIKNFRLLDGPYLIFYVLSRYVIFSSFISLFLKKKGGSESQPSKKKFSVKKWHKQGLDKYVP